MIPIVPIYPPALFKDPRVVEMMRRDNVQSPISIEHSLIACSKCGEQGWIGPKQREMAAVGLGEIICVYCLNKDQRLAGPVGLITLNADIDKAPRRTT